jgi:hypothetical protein
MERWINITPILDLLTYDSKEEARKRAAPKNTVTVRILNEQEEKEIEQSESLLKEMEKTESADFLLFLNKYVTTLIKRELKDVNLLTVIKAYLEEKK